MTNTNIKREEGKHTVCEIKDKILYFTYTNKGLMDMNIAETIVKERLKLCNGKDYPTLFKYDDFEYANRDVRNYMRSEGLKGINAGAILAKSSATKTFFSFYLAVSNLNIPAKVFTKEKDAIAWLMQFTR